MLDPLDLMPAVNACLANCHKSLNKGSFAKLEVQLPSYMLEDQDLVAAEYVKSVLHEGSTALFTSAALW
jgi:hypothetical protein